MRWAGLATLALSTLLAVPADAQPEQVHASWLGDGTVGIAWVRPGDVTATTSDSVRLAADGRPVGPDSVAYIAPGVTVHKARVPLPPGAVDLAYQVGSDAGGWSAPATLRTEPASGGPWRIVAFGDHGTGAASEASAALPAAALRQQPLAVLHLGDIAYADGDPTVWDEWFRLIEPLASSTLYLATPGNHEHEGFYPASGPSPAQAPFAAGALDPYEQYRKRFLMPGDPAALRYSVDLGPVHVVSINSEDLCVTQPVTYRVPWRVNPACGVENANVPEDQRRTFPPNQELLDWVAADLAAHAEAPWTIVFFHRPVHSAGAYAGEQVLREHFAPLFERHGVDLVLSGHDHNYQRSHPLVGGEPVATDPARVERGAGPVYIVSGGGGEGYYSLDEQAPAWTAARTEAFHFLVLDVWPDGLRGTVVETLTGEALDTFVVGAIPEEAGAADRPEERGSPLPLGVLLLAPLLAGAWRARRRHL